MSTIICPLDIEVGNTYEDEWARRDGAEETVFTAAAVKVEGVSVKVTDTHGNSFRYGGLYRGLRLIEVAA